MSSLVLEQSVSGKQNLMTSQKRLFRKNVNEISLLLLGNVNEMTDILRNVNDTCIKKNLLLQGGKLKQYTSTCFCCKKTW